MPERPFAFAADSFFVQVRKAHIELQSLHFVAGTCSLCGKTCKFTALESGIRPKIAQKMRSKSFCAAT
jgi:hypothetical protein